MKLPTSRWFRRREQGERLNMSDIHPLAEPLEALTRECVTTKE